MIRGLRVTIRVKEQDETLPMERGYGIEADGQYLNGNSIVFLQVPGGN